MSLVALLFFKTKQQSFVCLFTLATSSAFTAPVRAVGDLGPGDGDLGKDKKQLTLLST